MAARVPLLLPALALLCVALHVRGACVGFALAPAGSPEFDQAQSVAQGLTLWQLKHKQHTLALVEADQNNGSLAQAYLTLPARCALIGPVSPSDTILVAQALVAAVRQDTVFASLTADDVLSGVVGAGLTRVFSLAPPAHAASFAALQELADKEEYVWTLLGSSAPSDQRLLNETKAYLESDEQLFRTVQHVGTFDPAVSGSLSNEVQFISRLRPRPSVLMVSWEDLGGPSATRIAAINTLVDAFAEHEAQPRAIWVAQSLASSTLEKRLKKRIKYWSSNAMWSRTLDIGSGKSKLGKAGNFGDAYKDEFGVWPDDFAAIGAASALVASALENQASVAGFELKPEPFWGPVLLTANGTNLRAQWRWVQYLPHKEESIDVGDQDDATRNSLSYPGRWQWRDYSLGGDAIAAIVIAALLALIALGIFGWAGVRAVYGYLYGHTDSEEEEEENAKKEKDAKGKKRD